MRGGQQNDKKVAILNGQIEHVYHNDEELVEFIIENAVIEEREMERSDEMGWFDVNQVKQFTDKDLIKQLESDNADLWYENMTTKSQLEASNQEIADLWYQILIGGNE